MENHKTSRHFKTEKLQCKISITNKKIPTLSSYLYLMHSNYLSVINCSAGEGRGGFERQLMSKLSKQLCMSTFLQKWLQMLRVPKRQLGKLENAQPRRAKMFFFSENTTGVLPGPSILHSTGLYLGTSEYKIIYLIKSCVIENHSNFETFSKNIALHMLGNIQYFKFITFSEDHWSTPPKMKDWTES